MAKSNKKQIGRALFNLRKNKGSVLFLIVAIMSVMVILASALYYSLSTARRQVEVKYDSQQAYQSALALNDLIVNYINIRNDDAFVQAIIDLNQNESLVTKSDDGSGFSELAGGLGDYKVTVNKVKGDASDEIHVLEIEVSIDVNGENSTISTIGEFKVKSKAYNFDRFFTSTGYAPNDVIFKNMNSENETIYLDNEYTQFGGGSGHNVKTIGCEIITAGTIRFEAPSMIQNSPLTIGNNAFFYNVSNGFSSPLIRIGGNAVWLASSGTLQGDITMYVLGDFYMQMGDKPNNTANYINGDMVYKGQNPPDKKLYINGDLFFEANNAKANNSEDPKFIVGGNVYYSGDNGLASGYLASCKGNVYNLQTNTVFYHDGTSGAISTDPDAFNENKMYFKLESSEPGKYETDEQIRNKLDYIEEYCGNPGNSWANVWPSLDGTCEDIATVRQRINEKIGNPEYINWDLEAKFHTTEMVDGMPVKVVDPRAKVLTVTLPTDSNNGYSPAIKATSYNDYYVFKGVTGGFDKAPIVFDTFMGDYNNLAEVKNKEKYANMYIYLEPNCYVEDGVIKTNDPDDGIPDKTYDCFTWDPTGNVRFVLTRGMGSVTFVVPDGVKYIQPYNGYVGHIGIFNEMTNAVKVKYENGEFFYRSEQQNMITGSIAQVKQLCGTSAMGTKNIISQELLNEYGNPDANLSHAWYIHNNVFLAAIGKNADMDFSGGKNMLSAFVYAPYMTYNSEGIYTPGDNNSMFGGMIVSDFIQSSQEDFYICTIPYDYYGRYVNTTDTPEKQEETRISFMERLMSESLEGEIDFLTSSTSRAWRKFGYN